MHDRGVRIGGPVWEKPITRPALFSAVEAVLPQGSTGARRLDNRRRLIRWAMSAKNNNQSDRNAGNDDHINCDRSRLA
jgi:hypothetical protein